MDAPLPPLVAAVLAHLPGLEAAIAFACPGAVVRGRSYRLVDGAPVVTIVLRCDEQSDHPCRDEDIATERARVSFVEAGFVVEVVEPCVLRVLGRVVPAAPVSVVVASVPERLSVVETFSGSWVERWEQSPAAQRRLRQLRKAFGRSVATYTEEDRRKLWSGAGADRRAVEVLVITYCAKAEQIPVFVPVKKAA